MAQRPKFGPLTPPPLPGVDFLTEHQAGMKGLFDAAVFPLTGIGGTASDLTASLAWDLDAGLIDGMKFSLTWAADNTGPMTLALNGGSPVNLLDETGGAMLAGAARAGTRALVEYIGGAFRALTGADASAADQRFFWAFTASGTWTKPPGALDDAMVFVEAWGGGGGGRNGGSTSARNGGGGGGGYVLGRFRLGDLPSSVAIAIGAGGAVNAAGGNTTFGTLLTAYGGGTGGQGDGGSNGGGGGGGGMLGQGGNGTNASGVTPGNSSGGKLGGGPSGSDATSPYGGGGGAGGGTNNAVTAGSSYFGGGGGATGNLLSAAGVSVFGGGGGAANVAGQAPGGGGGGGATAGPGARGEVRIWI